jgi:hypothetical protein
MNAPLEHKSVMPAIAALEKKLGNGATYGARERALISEGVVPEWLFRARLMLKGPAQAHAARLVEQLIAFRKDNWAAVRLYEHEVTPPVAVKEPGEH